jgi:hypothetical protein
MRFFYFRDGQATADIAEETPGDFREPEGNDLSIFNTSGGVNKPLIPLSGMSPP